MQIEWDPSKEALNRVNHGLDFSFAEYVVRDPLSKLIYDRFEGGEHRWHAVGYVGNNCLVLVHTYPDPENEDRIRVIGLRLATPLERKRYEDADD